MGYVTSEEGVLKLVHPGGFVEVHYGPMAAAQVMAKNPRHCVTRPDVFKFPWIVVRPESILKPGRVYFIVPFRTIHQLLVRSLDPTAASALSVSPLGRRVQVEEMQISTSDHVRVMPMIKSCLKKPGCSTRQERRVVFDIPSGTAEEEEEEEEEEGL
ncbi:hypothetical protein DsansV1_C11g0105901 [Dioscorea sansibarensis]